MNSDKMFLASKEMIVRTNNISQLTDEIHEIKRNIRGKGNKVKEYGVGVLKNLAPKKVIAEGIVIKSKWGNGEDKVVFANYGLGIQSKWNTNATSINDIAFEEFQKLGVLINSRGTKELEKFLKPEKIKILKKYLKNFDSLEKTDKKREVSFSKPIDYVSKNILSTSNGWGEDSHLGTNPSKFIKRASKPKIIYDGLDDLNFKDDKNREVSVSMNSPHLQDALILEQIFDETKEFLEIEIERLKQIEAQYDNTISDLKKDFSNELMFMELAKTN